MPQRVEIKEAEGLKDLGFEQNQCLKNSYLAAKELDCYMVEGILMTIHHDCVSEVCSHCWNRRDNQYFDVTKDFVWSTETFKKELIKNCGDADISYRYFSCEEYTATEARIIDNELTFKNSYKDLIDYIKKPLP